MRSKSLLLACLLGCVSLPHVDRQPRTRPDIHRTTVRVDSGCSDVDDVDAPWASASAGTGVVISERHVLTAAHNVRCPGLPNVYVTLLDGRRFRVVVERDDYMFGSGLDVARLEIASAERFNLGVAPPALHDDLWSTPPSGELCAAVRRPNLACGVRRYYDVVVRGMRVIPGDSGAGVYDSAGRLIGLVSRVAWDGSYTRIVNVDRTWLVE